MLNALKSSIQELWCKDYNFAVGCPTIQKVTEDACKFFDNQLVCIIYRVRTPGGRLVYQYLKKPKRIPRCGQCKEKLRGIVPARPMERARICKRKQTVKRAYGGVLCHRCVKERIIRAFLIEEQKIVQAVLKAKQEPSKPQPHKA